MGLDTTRLDFILYPVDSILLIGSGAHQPLTAYHAGSHVWQCTATGVLCLRRPDKPRLLVIRHPPSITLHASQRVHSSPVYQYGACQWAPAAPQNLESSKVR